MDRLSGIDIDDAEQRHRFLRELPVRREAFLHLGDRWFLGYDFDAPTLDHALLGTRALWQFGL